MCFTDGTLQLSAHTNFPQTFHSLCSRFVDINHPYRQKSFVKAVLFGANDSCIVETDREVISENVSEAVRGQLLRFIGGDLRETGVSLGERSVLCPGDPNFCFLEAKRRSGPTEYFYNIPPSQASPELMAAVVAGQAPPQHLVPGTGPYASGGLGTGGGQAAAFQSGPPTGQAQSYAQSDPFAGSSVGPPASFSSSVPPEARTRYELQFNDTAAGRPFITGVEAAMLFMTSGLTRTELGKIWQESDLNSDGRFDLDEFVTAMWQVERQAQGQSAGNPSSYHQSQPYGQETLYASQPPYQGQGGGYGGNPPYAGSQNPY